MRKKTLSSRKLVIALVALFTVIACKKFEHPSPHPPEFENVEQQFFNGHRSADPIEEALVRFIQRKQAELGFVDKTVSKIGFPYWNKIIQSSAAQKRVNRGGVTDSSKVTFYIPFAREDENYVNAAMVIRVSATDTTFSYLQDWQYREVGEGNSNKQEITDNFAVLFMVMDREVFDHKNFRIKDAGLFNQGSHRSSFIRLDSASGSSQTARQVTVCQSVTIFYIQCPYKNDHWFGNPCIPKCDECHLCQQFVSWNYCWQEWEDDYGTGGGSPGGGGTGGGGDGNNPGTPSDPCNGGGGGATNRPPPGGDPCNPDPGWEPDPNPEPDPSLPVVDPPPYLKDAAYLNVSTYITPAGVPVTFPAGTQVNFYTNVDVNVMPNGALYSFILPNGKKYIAIQKEYLLPGATVVPKPEFEGYYEIDPDTKKVNFHSPLPAGTLTVAPTVNGVVRTVRMRVQKDANGNCQMVRELVDYSPGNVPTSYTANANANYSVQYLSAVPGTQETQNLASCPGGSIAGSTTSTLATFMMGDGPSVATFLQNHIKSQVKIYLYDCATNKAKHTISNGATSNVPTAQQDALISKFDTDAFTSTDEEIAIKACMENGRWKYDVKFNKSRMGDIDPRVEPVLNAVLSEIRKQADLEAENLRGVGRSGAAQTIIAGDGEIFYKAYMDLFKSLSAIYDVGKHIVNHGTMPAYLWDQGFRSGPKDMDAETAYGKSPFTFASVLGGAGDQFLEEATGVVQLTKLTLEAVRHPQETFDNVYKGVRSLNKEKVKQLIADATGYANYAAGGNLARYQAGKHAVQVSMIMFSSVRTLTKGSEIVREAGDGVTDLQKFIPDGSTNHPSAAALRNATDNQRLVKNLDNEKLVTRNLDNGAERVVVIDKKGDVYNNAAINNVDALDDDVLKAARPADIADAADNIEVFQEMRDYKQNFIDGKRFENRITNDISTKTNVQVKSGIDLSSHQRIEQVQLKTTSGDYFVADEVYFKQNLAGDYEIVINEIKINNSTPFSKRQNEFLTDLRNGQVNFELRNIKFNGQNDLPDIPQGTMFNVQAVVKTAGDGTVNGVPSFTKFVPGTNSWQ